MSIVPLWKLVAKMTGRSLDESPRIDELPVGVRSQPGDVRDESGLGETVAQQAAILEVLDPRTAGRPPNGPPHARGLLGVAEPDAHDSLPSIEKNGARFAP